LTAISSAIGGLTGKGGDNCANSKNGPSETETETETLDATVQCLAAGGR